MMCCVKCYWAQTEPHCRSPSRHGFNVDFQGWCDRTVMTSEKTFTHSKFEFTVEMWFIRSAAASLLAPGHRVLLFFVLFIF